MSSFSRATNNKVRASVCPKPPSEAVRKPGKIWGQDAIIAVLVNDWVAVMLSNRNMGIARGNSGGWAFATKEGSQQREEA